MIFCPLQQRWSVLLFTRYYYFSPSGVKCLSAILRRAGSREETLQVFGYSIRVLFFVLGFALWADEEANKEIKNNSESIRRKKCPPVYDFCPLQRRWSVLLVTRYYYFYLSGVKMFLRQSKAGVEKKRYKFLVILFEFCFLYLVLLSGADKEANK